VRAPAGAASARGFRNPDLCAFAAPPCGGGRNSSAAAAKARAGATYKDADAVLRKARQIQARLAAQDAELGKILESFVAAEGA
jgi:hypothetical protein